MDIICIFNGLGNQMSQYAFYLAKKNNNDTDVYWLNLAENHFEPHNGFELTRVFGIPETDNLPSIIKIISKIRFGNVEKSLSITRRIAKLFTRTIRERRDYKYDELQLTTHKCINYFIGGWHCELYFKKIESKIRSQYTFDTNLIGEKNLSILYRIRQENSVSIHLRRGDYVGRQFDGICPQEYYLSAISKINEILNDNDLKYYVFSDDIECAKSYFIGNNFFFVNNNKGVDSWIDMCLMSNCKHNIIANSTFSWWAAWLNPNLEKVVIAPNHFISTRETPDFYPSKWIKIGSARI